MPEGDTIHRAAASLRVLVGERVEAESPHPRGVATGVAAAVDGRRLERVEAVGKNLVLRFEGGVVVRSHLRMNGRWRVQPRGAGVLGSPWLVLRSRRWEAIQRNGPVLTLDTRFRASLGPDVLDADVATPLLVARLRGAEAGRLLGDAILDQRVLSGVGNMWAAEALWHARLSPWLAAADATADELTELLEWVRAAMAGSVEGSRPGRAVYRRAGRPCGRCGEHIRSRGLGDANRTAFWCPGCQRGPSAAPG
jgi:endonuclease-8